VHNLHFPGLAFGDGLANAVLRARQDLRDAEASLAAMEQSHADSDILIREMRLLVAHRKAVLAPLEALANVYRRSS
jgi:hypothetical protein